MLTTTSGTASDPRPRVRLETERLLMPPHPDNAPSRALATRLGFRVHREDVTPSGVRGLVYDRPAP